MTRRTWVGVIETTGDYTHTLHEQETKTAERERERLVHPWLWLVVHPSGWDTGSGGWNTITHSETAQVRLSFGQREF